MAYLVFSVFVVAGLWIGVLTAKYWSQFEDLCRRLANLREERAELDSGRGGTFEGLDAYREKVLRELTKPSGEFQIPPELEAEALEIGERLAMARKILIVYLAALALPVLYLSTLPA